MKKIKKLLKHSRKIDGKTKVKLQLHIPLKKLRANDKLLASLGASKLKIVGESKPTVKKAKPKARAKEAVKKTVERKKAAVKGKPKARQKKLIGTKAVAKKAAAKKSNTTRVTQAAVLAALGAKHSTPQAIANAIHANPVQVSRALSRYARQGLIVRTEPGQYALKPS